jgi:hypothetical protein
MVNRRTLLAKRASRMRSDETGEFVTGIVPLQNQENPDNPVNPDQNYSVPHCGKKIKHARAFAHACFSEEECV